MTEELTAPTREPREGLEERGLAMRERLLGEDGARALEGMRRRSPKMATWAVEDLFGECYGDETLDLRTRSLCTIAALTVLGRTNSLENHLRAAMRIGISEPELTELLMQMMWYGGLPAASDAFRTFDRAKSAK